MVNDSQIRRLWALARNAGVSHDLVYEHAMSRYGREHLHALTAREYEQFTRDLQDWARRQEEPDIAPTSATAITSEGGFLIALAQLSVDDHWWTDATDRDAAVAAKLLNCFRRYRTGATARLSLRQVQRIVDAWIAYPLPVWREAAERYLTQHTSKDEKYFLGIVKRVERETRRSRTSVAA